MPECMLTAAMNTRALASFGLIVLISVTGSACRGETYMVRRWICEAKLEQRASSPDAARVAWLYRLNCGGAMNSYEGVVFLTERSQIVDPFDFERAQSALYPFHADTMIVWQDDRHLIVRCPTCEEREFKTRNASWKDVSLSYERWENATLH